MEEKINSDLKRMIYRIIQEQTKIIIKYADATEVIISIRKKRTSLHMSIKDNGKGLDVTQLIKDRSCKYKERG